MAGASYLLHDEAGQDVHDEAPQAGVHGQGLDDGPHEQHGQGTLLHQLLHHHGQHLRCVHVPLRKAQVGGCEEAESGPVLAQLPRRWEPPLPESHSPTSCPDLLKLWAKEKNPLPSTSPGGHWPGPWPTGKDIASSGKPHTGQWAHLGPFSLGTTLGKIYCQPLGTHSGLTGAPHCLHSYWREKAALNSGRTPVGDRRDGPSPAGWSRDCPLPTLTRAQEPVLLLQLPRPRLHGGAVRRALRGVGRREQEAWAC